MFDQSKICIVTSFAQYMYIYIFSMIDYQQASSMIDHKFYMEQLLKPEKSLRTTGPELVPSNCEQQA